MYKKRNNKQLEILGLYTSNLNEEFYLREISKLANLPLKSTQDTLKDLEESSILKSKTKGKNKYFSLNLKEPTTKLMLIQAEIYKTVQFLEKNQNFKTFFRELNTTSPIILFGSYAKGTQTKNSDIDLLVLSGEKLLTHLLPKTPQVQILSEEAFLKNLNKEPLLKEIKNSHIILNNAQFYINSLYSKNDNS